MHINDTVGIPEILWIVHPETTKLIEHVIRVKAACGDSYASFKELIPEVFIRDLGEEYVDVPGSMVSRGIRHAFRLKKEARLPLAFTKDERIKNFAVFHFPGT